MYHGGSTDQVYAKLTSLVLSQGEDSSCQLRFYYYMYGTNVGKLTIGTTQYGGNGTENVSSFQFFTKLQCLTLSP